MKRTFLLPVAFATVAAAIACGGSGTSTPTGLDDTCAKFFDAGLGLGQRCGDTLFEGSRTDFIATCKANVAAPGSGLSEGYLSSCTNAINGSSVCNFTQLAGCKATVGKLAVGAACGDSNQCSTGKCKVTDSTGNGPSCGTCAKVSNEGEACNTAPDNLSCAPDLACTNKVCAKVVVIAAGGTCSFTGPEGYNCAAGSFCNAPFTPNATGTCAPIPKKGESCTAVCDGALVCSAGKCADKLEVSATCASSSECKSAYCDSTKKCAAQTIAKSGEVCGGAGVKCDTGLSCETDGQDNQKCVALKKSGEACAPTDHCAQYLVCSGGLCVTDDPGLCK
ncbi:hypothetical protein BH09MYX1_BH09MYX1_25130 [soil metagenome]